MAAEALPEPPDGEEGQGLADRMVERMKQRREGADGAQRIAEGDDADMFDAMIGKEPFRVSLKNDEPGGNQDRHDAENDEQFAGKLLSERVPHRRNEAHD